jgi:hypothetical protein
MRVILSRFLRTGRIQHTDTTEYVDALRELVTSQKHNVEAVTYNQKEIFQIANMLPLGVDKDGNSFFESSINRQGDIVDNFSVISKLSTQLDILFFVGKDEYRHNELDEFVIAAAAYEDFVIRITFKQTPHKDEVVELHSRYYIFNTFGRQILKSAIVVTRNCFYGSGMCCKISRQQ